MKIHFTVTAEIDATEFFAEKGVDWEYCKQHATYQHKEACEFILHVGTDDDNSDHYKETLAEMMEFGCTDEFILAYREAAGQGAVRVIFYT